MGASMSQSMQLRDDLAVIARNIPAGSRVLDLGCGDGELLSWLIRRRACTGTGVERGPDEVLGAIKRGVPLIELDIDGLATWPVRGFFDLGSRPRPFRAVNFAGRFDAFLDPPLVGQPSR